MIKPRDTLSILIMVTVLVGAVYGALSKLVFQDEYTAFCADVKQQFENINHERQRNIRQQQLANLKQWAMELQKMIWTLEDQPQPLPPATLDRLRTLRLKLKQTQDEITLLQQQQQQQ